MLATFSSKGDAFVIWESGPWKEALLKDADLLDRWASRRDRAVQRDVIFEKKIFLAAYSMRRLIEAEKLCSSFEK